MNAMLGFGLLASAVLLFSWSFGQFRRPQPRAWAQSDTSAIAATLLFVCLFTFSLAFLGTFLVNIRTETRWLEIGLTAGGALLLCCFLVPRLMAPAFESVDPPSALNSPPTDSLPEPANDPHPTAPDRQGSPAAKRHKKRAA
jgi:hypothetical protein